MSKAQKRKINSGQFKKGHKPWIKGKYHSQGTRRKLSEARKGEKGFWYGKQGTNYGKHFSEKTKRKMSKAQKGRKHTEEQNRKHSEAMARPPLYFPSTYK